jgi:hypothetical protein
MLARTLGDPLQAQAALDRLLADLASEAGAFAGGNEAAAQDWLFARMRLIARKSGGDGRPAPKLYAVPAPAPSAEITPTPAPLQMGASHRQAESKTRADDEDAPDLSHARLRRPGSAARPAALGTDEPSGRSWLRLLALLFGAATIGSCLAVLAVTWLTPERPAEIVDLGPAIPAAEMPAPAAPLTPPVTPGPPATAPKEPLPEPTQVVDPPSIATHIIHPPPPAEPAILPPRVVVHHGDGAESRAVAEQLAAQLQSAGFGEVEVRAVPFQVATASIRYFYNEDRRGAERLVAAIGPFLSWHGRAAPSTPIGFTDFRPLPRRGTLEIWLPRR